MSVIAFFIKPNFREAIVIFCPQGIIAIFSHPYQLEVV